MSAISDAGRFYMRAGVLKEQGAEWQRRADGLEAQALESRATGFHVTAAIAERTASSCRQWQKESETECAEAIERAIKAENEAKEG